MNLEFLALQMGGANLQESRLGLANALIRLV